MADDYRLQIIFEDEGSILHFGRNLHEREFEQELREQLAEGVVVTHDGNEVFLYASTPEQAQAAERAVREVLEHQGVTAEVSPVMRWHPVEERWEDATKPLPSTAAEVEAEHERQEQQEAEETSELGYAEWEVRIDLPSHRAAVELAERLDAEGITPIVRRWKYILIGTATDEDAKELARRLEAVVPEGATVKAEASAAIAWELTSGNTFGSLFGGFGPGPR